MYIYILSLASDINGIQITCRKIKIIVRLSPPRLFKRQEYRMKNFCLSNKQLGLLINVLNIKKPHRIFYLNSSPILRNE